MNCLRRIFSFSLFILSLTYISAQSDTGYSLAKYKGSIVRTPEIYPVDVSVSNEKQFTILVREISNYEDKLFTWSYHITFSDGSSYSKSFIEPMAIHIDQNTFGKKPVKVSIRKVPGNGSPVYIDCEIISGFDKSYFSPPDSLQQYILPVQYSTVLDNTSKMIVGGSVYNPTEIRLPNHVVTNDGTIIVVAGNCKLGSSNYNTISISKDNGKTWSTRVDNIFNQGALLYDKINNVVWSFSGGQFYKSDNNGESFVATGISPVGVNPLKQKLNELRQNEKENADNGLSQYRFAYKLKKNPCPTVGIQLKNGVLALPFMYQLCKYEAATDANQKVILDRDGFPEAGSKLVEYVAAVNTIVYSKDFGNTWYESISTPLFDGNKFSTINESAIVELKPNKILINSRKVPDIINVGDHGDYRSLILQSNRSIRNKTRFTIKGFKVLRIESQQLWDVSCQASFIKCDYKGKQFWLFCNCYAPGKSGTFYRKNLMLQLSCDCKYWTRIAFVSPYNEDVWGYSCLNCSNDQITLTYETSSMRPEIRFVNLSDNCEDAILKAYDINNKKWIVFQKVCLSR